MFKDLFSSAAREAIEQYITADEIFQRISLFIWGLEEYNLKLLLEAPDPTQLKWLALMSRGIDKRLVDLAYFGEEIVEFIRANKLVFDLDEHHAHFSRRVQLPDAVAPLKVFTLAISNPSSLFYMERQVCAHEFTELYCKACEWADFIEIIPSDTISFDFPPRHKNIKLSEPFLIPVKGTRMGWYRFKGEENTPVTVRYCIGYHEPLVYPQDVCVNKQCMLFQGHYWPSPYSHDWEIAPENRALLASRGLPLLKVS